MLPMLASSSPLTGSASVSSRSPRWRGLAAALLAALVVAFPGLASAETGGPLPQGYANDIPAGRTAGPSVQVQQVNDTDDEEAPDDYADTDPSALTDFQEPLAPYGVWVDDGTYGTVWVPDTTTVGVDFAPYQSGGHWVLDDNSDWMWASDYDWGYIPFHYGRWVWIGGRGWAWIPGRVYAPAWVTWRVGDAGYIGWAPMPPTWYWSGGVAVGLWTTPYAAYCFCPTAYVFHERVYTYVIRDATVVRTAAGSTHPHKAATPTVNGPHGTQPDAAHAGRRGFRPAAPSLAEAGIAASSAPKVRVAPDARARSFASRASTAAVRRSSVSSRTLQGNVIPSHRGGGDNPWQGSTMPTQRGQVSRAPSVDLSSRGAPVYNNDARFSPPAAGAQGSPRFSPPAAGAQGSPRFSPPPVASPRFSPPASTPRFSPPAPTPRFSPAPAAPRPTFSTPSFRPSAPSFRPSAPAARPASPSFGGGHRGGRR